jgi:hypothetical protein
VKHFLHVVSDWHSQASAQQVVSTQLVQVVSTTLRPHLGPVQVVVLPQAWAQPVVQMQLKIAAYFVRPATWLVVQVFWQVVVVQPW